MTPWIFLADPPAVPGLAFRGFQGPGDYPSMAAVLNAACAADGIDRFVKAEDVRRDYEFLDNCDPETDMVFAEIDGEPVAYGRITWWEESEGRRDRNALPTTGHSDFRGSKPRDRAPSWRCVV